MPEQSKIAPFCRTVGVGLAPPAHDAPTSPHIERRQRKMPVGVDAALSPADCICKPAHAIGDPAQRPVGADASVRPAVRTCKHGCTDANPHTVCRGRCPHRPVQQAQSVLRNIAAKTGVPTGRTGSSAPPGAFVFASVHQNLQRRSARAG